VTTGGRPSEPARGPYASFERQVTRIANARYVTFGLAATFFVLALVGAIVMRVADAHNFPSLGLAFWWALQTVTTVGYGDVVPTTSTGKVVGAIEMMIGISLISLLTAAVTSVVIQRGQTASREKTTPTSKRPLRRSSRQSHRSTIGSTSWNPRAASPSGRVGGHSNSGLNCCSAIKATSAQGTDAPRGRAWRAERRRDIGISVP
jgi:voltage-gated potassium channel